MTTEADYLVYSNVLIVMLISSKLKFGCIGLC